MSLDLSRTLAKWCAVFWTLTYLALLYPMLFATICVTAGRFDEASPWLTGCMILINSSILISLPTSIYLMWWSYRRKCYWKTHLSWVMPFLAFGLDLPCGFFMEIAAF